MATNNINILFWIHKSKKNKKGEVPVYLRLTYNGQRKTISTGFSILPARWDNLKGLAKGEKTNADKINAYIIQSKSRLMDLFNDMIKEGDISLDLLFDRFLGKDINSISLLELVDYHNKDFKSRIGIDYAASTFEKYDILRRKLEAFIPFRYEKKDIRVRDLKQSFIEDFDFYLKDHEKNQQNTATKYLKNLKKILSIAVLKQWIPINPFENYKAVYKDVDRVYLTYVELQAIEKKQFKSARLTLVKNLFLFQCYTGLSYTDMINLTVGNITPGIDGNKWIMTRRKKTNVRVAIPLLNEAENIILAFGVSKSDLNEPLFKSYAIQKFNSYLDEIASICEINKNLTSHVGRRTFATTIALSNGIGLETISKILGHTTTRITAQYAVVSDIKIASDINELRLKLKSKVEVKKLLT